MLNHDPGQDDATHLGARAACEDLGVVTSAVKEGGDNETLYRRVAELLGRGSAHSAPTAITPKRQEDVRLLIGRIERVLDRTQWEADEFLLTVGCDLTPQQVMAEINLDRCLTLAGLIENAIEDVGASPAPRPNGEGGASASQDDLETRRAAVHVIVEAFRAAAGNTGDARSFWDTTPDTADYPLAPRESVRAGRPSEALLALGRHVRNRRQVIQRTPSARAANPGLRSVHS
ncbi:MAG: hypothetical protein R2754_12745 [Microthrixaceae bacterium]